MLEPKKPGEDEGDGAKGKDVEFDKEKDGKLDKGGVDPDKGEK